MKKKTLLIMLIAIVVLVAIVALALNGKKKNIVSERERLNVSLSVEPDTLDPTLVSSVDLHSLLSNAFEGLVNIDEKGNFLPGMAETWSANDDNTEYTFNLRKDAKWSDDSQVTANDFKYAWLRVLNPETASPTASYLYYIKNAEKYNQGLIGKEEVGIEVKDDYTLVVYLEKPCSYFLSVTTLQSYLPIKNGIVEESGDSWGSNAEGIVTNGAFTIKEWNHDVNILMSKNENYWDSSNVYLNEINFLLYSDSTVIMNAYENNEIDFAEYTLTVDEMEQVDKVKFADFVYTRILEFNLDKEIFKNEKVREAITIALDREEMSNLSGTGCHPLTFFIPYGFINPDENKDYREDSNAKTYYGSTSNIEKAKELLKEAGYENGNGIPELVYLTNSLGHNVKNAEIVKSQLEKIGINVKINSIDRKLVDSVIETGNYDFTPVNLLAEYPDISVFLYSLRSFDFSNYANYDNKDYDELYEKIITEKDQKTKFELVHKAEDLLMENNIVIPLYYLQQNYIAKDNLKGYTHDLAGCLSFKNAYFEK